MATKNINWIKGLNKLFNEREDIENDLIQEEDRKGYMDATLISMLIPKTKTFSTLLLNTFEVEESKIPSNIFGTLSQTSHKTVILTYYLDILIGLQKGYKTVEITVSKDSPIKFETKDFIYIVAPRIEKK